MRQFDKPFDRGPAANRRFARWDEGFGPGRGGHGYGRGRRGGRRGRRGDVRAAVLALLVERPMHGYEMIQELDARTGGIWRPSPGSVYPTLQLLEDEGLIVSEQSEGRKRFTLTDEGREEAAKAAERAPWSEFADEDAVSAAREYRTAIAGVIHALGEVRASGTEGQQTQALEVLKETKRRLYTILAAEDEPTQ